MSALGGIWRSIWRFHGLLASILVFEYALAFAIVLAASGALISRARAINETSGVDESGLYVLHARGVFQPVHRFELFDARAKFEGLVGKTHVALGSSVPFLGFQALGMPISVPDDPRHPASMQVNGYQGDANFASVLGLRLLHGRWFTPDEILLRYGDASHLVILSETLARQLFHGEKAVGKQVEIAGNMHTVVGVVNPLAAPQYLGSQRTTYTLLLPKLSNSGNLLVIRYPGPAADLQPILDGLRKHYAGKVRWSLYPYTAIRAKYFRSDRLTVATLAGVVLVVLVTALCGILGLTNYWISRRRRHIAIRRALGAKKLDIVVHFLGETGLLVALGLVCGLIGYFFAGVYIQGIHAQFGAAEMLCSVVLILLLAMAVVFLSLRRWLRMNPVELLRAI